MAIVKRLVKGSALTHAELDGNFAELELLAAGAGPAFLFANRPSPTLTAGQPGTAGNIVRFTDIGPNVGGSLWISDGTVWRTLNGKQVLASGRTGAPGAGLTTVSAIGKMALPAGRMITSGSLVLPIGLLRAGVGLVVDAKVRHTGSAGTWTATWRLGTADASGDSPIVSNGGSATDNQAQWSLMDANFTTLTSFVTGFNMAPQGAAGAGSLATRTTNVNAAAVMYLGVHVSALTAGDTLELIDYCITLQD